MLDIQGDWNRRLNYSGTMGDTKREVIQREQELCIDERPPTQIFEEQISAGFFCDFVGVKAMAELDLIDNIMIEMDYPHIDSTWPDSLRLAHEKVAILTPEQQWKVLPGTRRRTG